MRFLSILNFWTPRFLVEIRYKSGHKTRIWFRKFYFYNGKYTWTLFQSRLIVRDKQILHLGVDDIEGIIQIRSRGIIGLLWNKFKNK